MSLSILLMLGVSALCLLLLAAAALALPAGGRIVPLLTRPLWLAPLIAFAVYTRLFYLADRALGLPPLYNLLIVATLALFAVRWLLLGESPGEGWKSAAWLYAAYVCVTLSGLLYAEFPESTLQEMAEVVPGGLVVLAMPLLIRSADTLRHTVWALIAAGLFLGGLTSLQHLSGQLGNDFLGFAAVTVMPGETARAAGPTSPNYFALHMTVLAPLAVDRLFAERSLLRRVVAGAAALAISLAIFFTYSRGGVLSLAAVLGLSMLRMPRRLMPLAAAALAAVVLLGLSLAPADWTARFARLAETGQLLQGDAIKDGAISGRLSEMGSGLMMWADHPLLGVGYGNFKPNYPAYAEYFALDAREDRAGHSLYLETAAEMGTLGLLMLAAVLGWSLLSVGWARDRFRAQGRVSEASMATAFGIGLIGFILGSTLLHLSFPQYFWMLVGTAIAMPGAARAGASRDEQAAAFTACPQARLLPS